jgi:hypothetical protein
MKNSIFLFLLFAGGTVNAQVAITVNTGANRQSISPYVYGLNPYHYDNTLTGLAVHQTGIRPASLRFGGDAVSTYNWEKNVNISYDGSCGQAYSTNSNNRFLAYASGQLASDYTLKAGAILKFYADAAALGAYPLVQLTAMQYAAADANGCLGTACLQGTSSGRKIRTLIEKPTALSTSPSLTDTVQYADEELYYLRQQTGAPTGPRGYCLENEAGIWSDTHPCAHALRTTCTEVLNKNRDLALRIRALDSAAEIVGPGMYGFTEYTRLNYTAAQPNPSDWSTYNMSDTVYNAGLYNQMTWVCSYLRQMRNFSTRNGKKLLDVLDLHYYNSGNNVAQDSRSFWDSAYVENSYIPQDILNGASLKLVHCVKRAIADWYPGTKMGFTEWGLMDNNSSASGVYVADMLGAFGKYGVYMAQYFGTLQGFTAGAFKQFRNYDGNGGEWGNTSVAAGSADNSKITAYAAISGNSDSTVHLMLINRSTATQTATVQLSAGHQFSTAQVWEMSGSGNGTITAQPMVSGISVNSFSYTLSGRSVVHLVLRNGVAGIGQVSQNPLEVYPNPATTRLFFKGSLPAGTPATVWDITGRAVLQTTLEGQVQNTSIDVERLPVGPYILQVDTNRFLFEKH